MFEQRSADELLTEIETCRQWESMLIARRMTAAAALLGIRIADAEDSDLDDPGYALVTGLARASAELGAALNLSPRAARDLVTHADSLATRLPRVAGLLAEGRADWPTVELILSRTALVDDDLMPGLDENLAQRIGNWQCWSRQRIKNTVDAAVRAADPDGAKERRVRADTERHVDITAEPNGMARLRGTLRAPDAAIFDKRLSEMAKSVCAQDPRTLPQRRADALVALSEGHELRCACGRPDCPQQGTAQAGSRFVINVIADQSTLTGLSDQPGYLEGYGVIDADQLRRLAESATLKLAASPPSDAAAEARYQPSAALERFIRSRDLTCRFPGCDRPAWIADIDHTRPFNHLDPAAGGPTAAHNLSCYCREHHRLKTFCGGPDGWRDKQLADGVIEWTSPTGRVYRTTPDGAEMFPRLRPACRAPAPRKRNETRERAKRITLARSQLRRQRPINTETRRINEARRDEISLRQWRNEVRKKLFLLKGGLSTSPFCAWVNDPLEPEGISADWLPPPPGQRPEDDEPPF